MNYTYIPDMQELATVTPEQCVNMCSQVIVSGYQYYIVALTIVSLVGAIYCILWMKNSREKYFFFTLFCVTLLLVMFLASKLQEITTGIYYG